MSELAVDYDRHLRDAQRDLNIKLALIRADWAAYVDAHSDNPTPAIVDVLSRYGATPHPVTCDRQPYNFEWPIFRDPRARPFDMSAKLSSHPPDSFFRSVRRAWNGMTDKNAWAFTLAVLRNSGRHLMTDEEERCFNALPDHVSLYRGFSCRSDSDVEHTSMGFSWSLDRNVASGFGDGGAAMGYRPFLASLTVPRTTIHSYFDQGTLSECVIDRPDLLTNIDIKQVEHGGQAFAACA